MNSAHSLAPSSFDGVFFVTMRMRDALPEHFGQNLGLQFYQWQVKLAQHADRSGLLKTIQKRLFVRFDEALDLEKYGYGQLGTPALAQIVSAEIMRGDGDDYFLWAYSILPNHVHLLLELPGIQPNNWPLEAFDVLEHKPLRKIITRIQTATEKPLKQALFALSRRLDPESFQKLTTKGEAMEAEAFWHPQTFDFRVSDAAELEKVMQYIRQNPMKAGVVEQEEARPFCYSRTY